MSTRRLLRAWLARIFAAWEEEVEEEARRRMEEDAERAARDPFRFSSFGAFRRHRARHGLRTRPDHPRYPW